jgi:FkbM family methyltransferase
MAGTVTKKLLLWPWKVLPLAARSRITGLRRSLRREPEVSQMTITEADKFRAGTPTLTGFLENLRDNGFSPSAIVDIGANAGEWSRTASSIFPSAQILMFDGDPENEPNLHNTVREIGSRSRYFLRLLGPERKETVTFYRPETGTTGSSVLPELTSFGKNAITLSMDTLDSLIEEASLRPSLLLKLDVQGFELEVLKGGRQTLALSEIVIMEAALLPYNDGAPLFADVVAFMDKQGFVVFDFCGQLRRESDHALFQTDVAFVRRESNLRAPRRFWLNEP